MAVRLPATGRFLYKLTSRHLMGVISRIIRKVSAVLCLPTRSGKTARNDLREQMGFDGELEAARHLKRNRLKILVHRYRCRLGEIDLVAREGDTLVFVEVKTRRSADFGEPAEAVTPEKQKHISRVALDYLRRLHNPEIPVRFDVVEIVSSGNAVQCHHIRDAFPLAEPYIY